jgi:hypothetical protein
MIQEQKRTNALWALQGVLVAARFLADTKESHESIAQILDTAEILPRLIAEEADRTQDYEKILVELATRHPRCGAALEHFRRTPAPDKW